MKLAPRKRRERTDYLVDNAAALQLGRLFLGWGKKRSHSAKKSPATSDEEKKPTPTRKADAKKSAPPPAKKAPAKRVAKTAVAKTSSPPRKRPQVTATKPAPAKKSASRQRARAPSPPVKKITGRPRKFTPPPPSAPLSARAQRRGGSAAKAGNSTPRKAALSSAPLPSARPRPPTPVPPPVHSSAAAVAAQTVASPATNPVVVQRRPHRAAAPPVIPNPVPTPALPTYTPTDPVQSVDSSQMVTITVRTMNGSSFRLVLTADTILYELKRQILGVIAPGPTLPNTFQRLPMLVMNGRALMPDNATLRSLRFTALSTVYCFPEPS